MVGTFALTIDSYPLNNPLKQSLKPFKITYSAEGIKQRFLVIFLLLLKLLLSIILAVLLLIILSVLLSIIVLSFYQLFCLCYYQLL